MKTMLLAASAVALLCTTLTPVAAQSASSAMGGAGMLCSDLSALDPAAQTAFLQGYSAGRQDAMMSAGGTAGASTDAAAAGSTTTGAGAAGGTAGATDTAAAGSATGAAGASGSADATATGSTTSTDSSNSGAAAGAGTAASTAMDFDALIASCAGAPTSSISDVMGGSGTSSP